MMAKLGKTIAIMLIMYVPLSQAALIGIDHVYGENSLYYDDWGHPYNDSGAGNEKYALGRGDPAEAWQSTPGNAYAFTPNQRILIEASGCVVDLGAQCTAPDYSGGMFRGLPFYIGSVLDLFVPSSTYSALYLFLATNDGIFKDNVCGSYSTNPCDNNGYPDVSQTYTVVFSEQINTRMATCGYFIQR